MLRFKLPRRQGRLAVVVALFVFSLALGWHLFPRALVAVQFQPGQLVAEAADPDGKIRSGILPVPGTEDTDARRLLRAAKVYIDAQRLVEAAKQYQKVLNALEIGDDQDLFQQRDGETETVTASIRGDVYRWFDNMRPDVRKGYELEYGTKAGQMLSAAIEAGDIRGLEKIYRLYFYTKAGQTAAYQLGDLYIDQGNPLRASFCFARLKRSFGGRQFEPTLSFKLAASQYWAGMLEESQATLAGLRKNDPNARITVGGREVPLFAKDDQALGWLAGILGPRSSGGLNLLDQVLVYRGNAARTAVSRGDEPVLLKWAQQTSYTTRLGAPDGVIPHLVQRLNGRSVVAMPCAHPLVVRDALVDADRGGKRGPVAMLRTLNSIVAVDMATGKRIWHRAEREPQGEIDPINVPIAAPHGPPAFGTPLAGDNLEQRLWNDAVYGQLSSDGHWIYLVQRPDPVQQDEAPNRPPQAADAEPPSTNFLQALELKSGEGGLRWQIDGGAESGPYAGLYFLGPPLPLGGTLYVLAEKGTANSGEIRLLAIQSRGGEPQPKLLWSQRVAVFDDAQPAARFGGFRPAAPSQGALRRRVGLSPSYTDGMLVCPTGLGAVVAIDLTNRSLHWGYKYPVKTVRYTTPMGRMQSGETGAAANLGHWADASVTITGGHVLLTPPLAGQLHCVSLADGKKQWTVPREDGLYVAGVHQGKVIVVGSEKVRAFKLKLEAAGNADRNAWPRAARLPEGSVPAGRGFISAGQYYLPLSSAEIAVIDLNDGKIISRLKSPEGRPLGNLVCYGDWVISQGAASIDCFVQRKPLQAEIVRRLTKDPDDAQALRLKAEVALHDGRSDEALALLRRSHQIEPDSYTRELLVDGLLRLLRSGPDKNHEQLAELGQLAQRREDRAEYLRMLAESHRQRGKPLEAFDVFVRLGELPPGRTTSNAEMLVAAGPRVKHGQQYLVRSVLSDLYRKSNAEQRAEFDRRIAARLKQAMAAEDAEALRRFLRSFGDHASAATAQREMVARALQGKGATSLEGEWALAQLEQSAEAATVRWAAAGRALLLAHAGRAGEAAAAYRRLVDDFGDVECRDDKTGRQLFDELPANSPIRTQMEAKPAAWPQGKVEQKVDSTVDPRSDNQPIYHVPLSGEAAWAKETLLYFDVNSGELTARDRYGSLRWQLALNDGEANGRQRDAWLNQAVAAGHLLVLHLGSEVVAVDTLHSGKVLTSGAPSPKVLWRRELVEAVPGLSQSGQFISRFERAPWGTQVRRANDQFAGRPLGRLGPVTRRLVSFQRGQTLVAVDPLTGRTLWQRDGLAAGSYLFGNEDVLAVAPPGGKQGLLLRSADGQEIGQPELAPAEYVMASLGAHLVAWEDDGNGPVIRLIDAADKQSKSLGRFAQGSKAFVVSAEEIAVLEPDGDFVMLHPATGKRTDFETKVKITGEKLTAIYVMRWQDQYLLATHRPSPQTRRQLWIPNSYNTNDPNRPMITGQVLAFAPSGKAVWPAPVAVENLHIALDQPPEVPVLVLTSSGLDIRTFNRRALYRVQCIDKRTGRTVYQGQRTRIPFVHEVSGDPENKRVELQFADGKVTLTFTDEAPPEKVRSEPAKEEK